MLNPELTSICLSKEEYKIYARHLILDSIGVNGQKRLRQARILFIGSGGLGCPGLLYLTASGVGSLGIIDNDKVSLSNLHRQILYTKADIDKLKTECTKEKLLKINPICNIKTYSIKLTKYNAIEIIQEYDIVLDASDNFNTRYVIDSACKRLHKVHIYGAIQKFEGQISVFNYKNGPRYSDLYPQYLNIREENCNDTGIIGVLTGLIGILQATEAVKIITGTGKILSGSLLIYNMLDMSFKRKRIRPKIQHSITHVINKKDLDQSPIITVDDLLYKIKNKENIVIIDIRQDSEFKQKHIKNSINIPLNEIHHKRTIDNLLETTKNKTLIIYCSNESRSIIASNILNKYKIDNLRLENGIERLKKENIRLIITNKSIKV